LFSIIKSKKDRIKSYRRYVYRAGAINLPDKIQAKVIDDKVVAEERKKEFELSKIRRFRYRTRYFTDSGIIGSKEFVTITTRDLNIYFFQSMRRNPNQSKAWMGCIR